MLDKREKKALAPPLPNRGQLGAARRVEAPGDLQMPPDEMLDLAHKVAEILVERIEKLP